MTQTNPFGKVSELSLVVAPGKMRHLSFTAPFKVLHPFRQDGFLQIMVVKVSAGLMAGGEAVREGRVTVGRDATLFYAPLPVLPFADSAFRSAFAIELADETSRLFYSDILACGRAARGERFAYRLYRSRVYITSGGILLYADNFRFAPQEDGADCEGFIQYEGYTHLGNYVLCHFPVREEDLRACFRPILDVHDCQAGLTRFGETNICLKVLANGSEMLVALQARIKDFLRCA